MPIRYVPNVQPCSQAHPVYCATLDQLGNLGAFTSQDASLTSQESAPAAKGTAPAPHSGLRSSSSGLREVEGPGMGGVNQCGRCGTACQRVRGAGICLFDRLNSSSTPFTSMRHVTPMPLPFQPCTMRPSPWGPDPSPNLSIPFTHVGHMALTVPALHVAPQPVQHSPPHTLPPPPPLPLLHPYPDRPHL